MWYLDFNLPDFVEGRSLGLVGAGGSYSGLDEEFLAGGSLAKICVSHSIHPLSVQVSGSGDRYPRIRAMTTEHPLSNQFRRMPTKGEGLALKQILGLLVTGVFHSTRES